MYGVAVWVMTRILTTSHACVIQVSLSAAEQTAVSSGQYGCSHGREKTSRPLLCSRAHIGSGIALIIRGGVHI